MNERRTSSYFGRNIKKLLDKLDLVPQADQLSKYLPWYVGKKHLRKLYKITSQLIYGRRGTGKTHVLGALKEYIDNVNHSLSIYINCAEFSYKNISITKEKNEFSKPEYLDEVTRKFLLRFVDKLEIQIQKYIEKNNVTVRKKKTEKTYEDYLLQLRAEIEEGRPEYTGKKRTNKDTKVKKSAKQQNSGINFSLNVFQKAISMLMNFRLRSKKARNEEDIIIEESESIFVIELNYIRTYLKKLIEELNISAVYILIDEWAEIDKNSPVKIQPEFANRIKIMFFKDSQISVKIASNWHDTKLYDRRELKFSMGLQAGNDIIEAIDLDEEFMRHSNDAGRRMFFAKMLFRRLSKAFEDKLVFERDYDRFIIEIFEKQRHFDCLIAASHGVPRDFIILFDRCCGRIDNNFQKYYIDSKIVRDETIEIHQVEKSRSFSRSSKAGDLYRKIQKNLDRTQANFFLLPLKEYEKLKRLEEYSILIDAKILHPIPSFATDMDLRNYYKVIQIDNGNYWEWHKLRLPLETQIKNHFFPDYPENIHKNPQFYELVDQPPD